MQMKGDQLTFDINGVGSLAELFAFINKNGAVQQWMPDVAVCVTDVLSTTINQQKILDWTVSLLDESQYRRKKVPLYVIAKVYAFHAII